MTDEIDAGIATRPKAAESKLAEATGMFETVASLRLAVKEFGRVCNLPENRAALRALAQEDKTDG